jgi:hypothetical protein
LLRRGGSASDIVYFDGRFGVSLNTVVNAETEVGS